jgi:hypothetical protein
LLPSLLSDFFSTATTKEEGKERMMRLPAVVSGERRMLDIFLP